MANSRLPQWFPRFSLRTLLLGVLLVASGVLIFKRRDAWVLCYSIPFESGSGSRFSPDSGKVAIQGKEIIVLDLATGKIITRLRRFTGTDFFELRWSTDGRWLLCNYGWGKETYGSIWDAEHWTFDPIADVDWKKHEIALLPAVAKTAYGRSLVLPSCDDNEWLTSRTSSDGHLVTADYDNCGLSTASGIMVNVYEDARGDAKLARLDVPPPVPNRTYFSGQIAPNGEWSVVCASKYPSALVYHRRRPEYWWGLAWLPEFWLTVVLGCLSSWSVWRDGQHFQARNATPSANADAGESVLPRP